MSADALFTGDWAGAFLAVLACLGSALVLILVGLLLLDVQSLGVGAFFAEVAAYLALTVGGAARGVIGGTRVLGGSEAHVSMLPLTATIVGFTLLAVLTARRLRARGADAAEIVMHAVRVVLALSAVMLLVSLLGHHKVTRNSVDGGSGVDFTIDVDIVQTLFVGALLTALAVMVMVIVCFPQVLPQQVRRVREAVTGPVLGMVTLALLANALALICFLLAILTHNDNDPTYLWQHLGFGDRADGASAVLLALPNLAFGLLLLGMGDPLYASSHGSTRSDSATLSTLTDHNGAWWLLPLVVIVLFVLAAAVTALHAPTPEEGRRNGYRLPLVSAVLLFLAALFSRLSISAGEDGYTVHSGYVLAFVLGGLWGGVAGVAVPQLLSRAPVQVIARARSLLVRRFGAHATPASSPTPPPTFLPPSSAP